MFAQLVDIPFAWVGEVEKNVIGLVAFLLLLGGIVFPIVAWAMTGQWLLRAPCGREAKMGWLSF